jgi:AcrR family transcriptional regulator
VPEPPSSLLPIAGGRRERADAARNRARVLDAARELFAERGAANVTMDDVAKRAGVAKGTLFHRFGDRSGLAQALVDEHERVLQDAIVHGPPPLGPGAPPRERLIAFLDALADLLERHGDWLYASETGRPQARYTSGAYEAWRAHVALLLGEMGIADDVLAHVILAPLGAELWVHLRSGRGISADRLRAALHALIPR